MKRTPLLAAFALLAMCAVSCTDDTPLLPLLASRHGHPLWPDYAGAVIPCNIAPLDFHILSPSLSDATVTVEGEQERLKVKARKGVVAFPMKRWHRLLATEKGRTLTVRIGAGSDALTFPLHVSADSIDTHLVYRLIAPGYEVWSHMGIYERDLTTFREKALLENTQFSGCVNCHAFNQCHPHNFSLHIRGEHGATLLRLDGKMDAYDTRTDSTLGLCVYPYWHPDGRYIAYSTNTTRQGFHVLPDKRIEVFDLASDLQVYDTERSELISSPLVRSDTVWETFPAFSPDGRTLYYCAARAQEIPSGIPSIRYNLCSIPFDASCGTFGTHTDTLIHAEAAQQSISFPRPSYDGRWLMYTQSHYGQFSIWHHEADLWLLDLRTGERRPLGTPSVPSPCGEAVNSDDTESFHSWSSNSRWFVFSSRREDGLHTRLYLCHIDTAGICGTPFLLPQRRPAHTHQREFRSYNVPDFATSPVRLDRRRAERLITRPERRPFAFRPCAKP